MIGAIRKWFRPSGSMVAGWVEFIAKELGDIGSDGPHTHAYRFENRFENLALSIKWTPAQSVGRFDYCEVMQVFLVSANVETEVFRYDGDDGLLRFNYGGWVDLMKDLVKEAKRAKGRRLELETNEHFADLPE